MIYNLSVILYYTGSLCVVRARVNVASDDNIPATSDGTFFKMISTDSDKVTSQRMKSIQEKLFEIAVRYH